MKKIIVSALGVSLLCPTFANAHDLRDTQVTPDNIMAYSDTLCGTLSGGQRISNGRGDRSIEENKFCNAQLRSSPINQISFSCAFFSVAHAMTGFFESNTQRCHKPRRDQIKNFRKLSFKLYQNIVLGK